MDPYKVFIGQLRPDINKPEVKDWLARRNMPKPTGIYIRPPKFAGGAQCCFLEFTTTEEAQACTFLEGDRDSEVTATRITASIIVTQYGSLSSL